MELYLIIYIFLLLLIIEISVSIFYSWIKSLHLIKCINEIPGLQMSQFAVYWMFFKIAYFDRQMVPAITVLLYAGCGMRQIFNTEGIFRAWIVFRPVVVFTKPETVQVLLSSNSNIDKSKEYTFLHPWLGTGLLTSTGDKWRARRKLLIPAFHFRILDDFMAIYNEQSQVLVEKLKRLTHKEWVDIVPLITMCTLDIICETTMGVRINAQANGDNEYINAIYELGEMFFFRGLRPWLWFDKIFYSFPYGCQFKKNLNILHSFTRKVIKEKKELLFRQRKENSLQKDVDNGPQNAIVKGRRTAFLELLLEHHINDNSLSEEDIREEVDTFMFEGHDTTAMAISWALYNIGLRPDVQEKILVEQEIIFKGDSERPVTINDLKAMKYLDCVIKVLVELEIIFKGDLERTESLRLYPSVPLIARELREDIQVLKYTVPKGALCIITPYCLHRDPEVYSNPEVFDPDRFLPKKCAGRHPYAYIPFSAGPRNCIGKKFAVMEEKTVIANILRNFSVKSLDERDKVNVEPNLVLRNVEPLRMKIVPR